MQKERKLLDVVTGCTAVRSLEDFIALLDGPVAQLLEHEVMICGIGEIGADGNFSQKFLNRNYPLEYYQAMLKTDGRINSPLMKLWRQTLQPVYFQSGRDEEKFPGEWITLFNKYDLRNIVGHGILDLNGLFSSYFIYSRLAREVGPEEVEILNLITPNLHNALARISSAIPAQSKSTEPGRKQFSERQLEILAWMNDGKSNWEIARIINTTEANVKYHIDQIFHKLGVFTRVQAVAMAKDLGLLSASRTRQSN
ncbi:hypothetical protein BH11PSE11_BH11PSE11_26590 [soil metagenome]